MCLWIPAHAGMTMKGVGDEEHHASTIVSTE